MSTAMVTTSATYDFGESLRNKANLETAALQLNLNFNVSNMGLPVLGKRNSNSSLPVVSAIGESSPKGVHGNGHAVLCRTESAAPGLCTPLPASLLSLVSPGDGAGHSGHRKADRSLSEPVERERRYSINTSRYKTELCRPYEESGSCKYGEKCQFAHGVHELRTLVRHPKYKTELCKTFHTNGLCPYGPRCHFIHNAEELMRAKAAGVVIAMSGGLGPHSGLHQGLPPPSPRARDDVLLNRQKLMRFGSAYSLGSAGESPSPPSSLSESPTSIGGFFAEDIINPSSSFSPSQSMNASPHQPNAPISFGQTSHMLSPTQSMSSDTVGINQQISKSFGTVASLALGLAGINTCTGTPSTPRSPCASDVGPHQDMNGLSPTSVSMSVNLQRSRTSLMTPLTLESLGTELEALSLAANVNMPNPLAMVEPSVSCCQSSSLVSTAGMPPASMAVDITTQSSIRLSHFNRIGCNPNLGY